jgi:hypothetical protein
MGKIRFCEFVISNSLARMKIKGRRGEGGLGLEELLHVAEGDFADEHEYFFGRVIEFGFFYFWN